MIIITDVNIILSALIKNSSIRKIITTFEQDFCFPEISLHKIRKYKELILEKSGLSEEEFQVLFNKLFTFIRIIPNEELKQYWDEARTIMEHIDPEDVTCIAAALSQGDALIWSEDKHFDHQEEIIVLKTKDIIILFQEK